MLACKRAEAQAFTYAGPLETGLLPLQEQFLLYKSPGAYVACKHSSNLARTKKPYDLNRRMSKAIATLLLFVGISLCQTVVASSKDEITAKHFALLVGAAHATLLPKAQQAQKMSPGQIWLDDCPQCLTPPATNVCDVPLTSLQADSITFPTKRFALHLEHGLCYIYGHVDRSEMAAIRKQLRGSLVTSFCPAQSANGALCHPKLLADDGSPLPLPQGLDQDSVIHVFRLAK